MSRPDLRLKQSISRTRSIASDLSILVGALTVCRKYDCEKPIVDAAHRAYSTLSDAVDETGKALREFNCLYH